MNQAGPEYPIFKRVVRIIYFPITLATPFLFADAAGAAYWVMLGVPFVFLIGGGTLFLLPRRGTLFDYYFLALLLGAFLMYVVLKVESMFIVFVFGSIILLCKILFQKRADMKQSQMQTQKS